MLYKSIVRPLMFLMDPEKVHHLIVKILKVAFKIPLIGFFVSKWYTKCCKGLEKEFCGLRFKNPVGLAAGFDKDARFFDQMSKFGFGFIEIGTVTPKAQGGNPKPRIFRIKQDQALINRMGFNNLGVDHAVEQLKKRKPSDLIIGGNIGKNTATPNENAVDDYLYCFEKLYPWVDYFVVNVSCPNVSNLKALQDHDSLLHIMQAIMNRRNAFDIKKPVLLKISPDLNFDQVDDVLQIIQTTTTDGIVVANTTVTRDKLSISEHKIKEIGNGGLSGAPLQKHSTELIRYIHRKTNGQLPMIGSGGIIEPSDALEKMEAGASLVQVYTGFIYYGPAIAKAINKMLLRKSRK